MQTLNRTMEESVQAVDLVIILSSEDMVASIKKLLTHTENMTQALIKGVVQRRGVLYLADQLGRQYHQTLAAWSEVATHVNTIR
eukprot:g31106.t1